MDDYGLDTCLFDASTLEEIPIRFRPKIAPAVGEEIHYWQDGTEEVAGGDAIDRHDWVVRRVSHDWRFMPGRHGGRALHVSVLCLYVDPFTPPAATAIVKDAGVDLDEEPPPLTDEDIQQALEGFPRGLRG